MGGKKTRGPPWTPWAWVKTCRVVPLVYLACGPVSAGGKRRAHRLGARGRIPKTSLVKGRGTAGTAVEGFRFRTNVAEGGKRL